MAAKKEVAQKEEYAVSTDVLGLFEADAGRGIQLDAEDVALPFLKVLSRQDAKMDELETARAGDIYNSVTNEVYKGAEGFVVVPCHYARQFLEWAPRGVGTGSPVNIYNVGDNMPTTSRDAADNKDYIDGHEDGHYLEETHQHYVVVIEEDGTMNTALISMKSTQLKKSRKWNSMVASRTMIGKNGLPFQPPRYSHMYRLKTTHEKNSKGDWHGWEITLEGPITDAAIFATAKQFADSISKGEVTVKHVDESFQGASMPQNDVVEEPTDDETPW
jgi:hypothetical protein